MKEEELKRLIEKYYKGTSTEEEEIILQEYLKSDNIPDGYEAEKVIFSYYESQVDIPEPAPDFETRILKGIEGSDQKIYRKRFRRLILPFISAAASILILISSYFYFFNRNITEDTFSDPKIAYAETIKILTEVSVKLNQGTKTLQPIGKINEMTAKSFEAFNKSTSVIEKNFRNMDYLEKAFEIANPAVINDK